MFIAQGRWSDKLFISMPALLFMIVGLSLHKILSMSVQLRSENRVGRVIFGKKVYMTEALFSIDSVDQYVCIKLYNTKIVAE